MHQPVIGVNEDAVPERYKTATKMFGAAMGGAKSSNVLTAAG
jgi:hypothetical protein